jgi:hypothetical protein
MKPKIIYNKSLSFYLIICTLLLLFGYDKQILSILPYRYIQKPFFQEYISLTFFSGVITDLLAILISFIIVIRCFLFIIKRNNKNRYLIYFLSSIILLIVSITILWSREQYLAFELKNCFKTDIKYINIDGERKIQLLKPKEKKWILYKDNYSDHYSNGGEIISFKLTFTRNKSRLGMYVFSPKSLIKIPDDNDDPGGLK